MSKSQDARPFTIDDIMADPHRFGAPTFEEFIKNPKRWRKNPDGQMIALTEGPQNFRKDLKKIRFFVHGCEIDSEEAVEKMLLDHGYSLEDIDLENKTGRLRKTIQMVDVGGGLDHELHVNFLP